MSGKSGVMFLLAVVCGLGAMYGTSQMLRKDGPAPPATQKVAVAARDLKAEEVLKEDMIEVKEVPKEGVPLDAIAEPRQLIDRWVRLPVLAGEVFVERKLAPRGSPPGLISMIEPGQRAFALEVNEQSGVSGFVLPGHRVDVIQAPPNGAATRQGPAAAETILEDVLVLASGQVFTRPEDKSIIVRTVTLSLSPEQVDVVVAARAKGPLALSLRGLNDHAKAPRPAEPPKVETVPVVVAAVDLEPGTELSAGSVRVADLPRDGLPADHFRDPPMLIGRKVRLAMRAGEPILDAKLERIGDDATPPRLARLEPGPFMRAVSLKVNDQTGVVGWVGSDDWVDLVLFPGAGADRVRGQGGGSGGAGPAAAEGGSGGMIRFPTDPADAPEPARETRPAPAPEAHLLLQRVRVLDPPRPTKPLQEAGVGSEAEWSVTLEVPAADVSRVAHARATGTLSLALRGAQDYSYVVPPRPATLRELVVIHGMQRVEHFPRAGEDRGQEGRYEWQPPAPLAGGFGDRRHLRALVPPMLVPPPPRAGIRGASAARAE